MFLFLCELYVIRFFGNGCYGCMVDFFSLGDIFSWRGRRWGFSLLCIILVKFNIINF